MIRNLSVTIDKSTWPTSGTPPFPPKFHSGTKIVQMDVVATLLLIGHLTTPALASGVSLSEFWAWVRYFYAIAPMTDLHITKEFTNLDSHQKTILSDDFGMGFPMAWLIDPLKLETWCDGRDFVKRFAALTATTTPSTTKKGATKCPDFVCKDANGLYHVIECKGTQGSPSDRESQFSHLNAKKQPSGAIAQKNMIKFLSSRGQRLACGLLIRSETHPSITDLKIIDPDGGLPIEVSRDQLTYAEDPVLRSSLARSLRAAGLWTSADAIAAPGGPDMAARPFTTPDTHHLEDERQKFVAARRERAQEELTGKDVVDTFKRGRTAFAGRSVKLTLPHPLKVDGKTFHRVEIRQGVRQDLLKRIAEKALDNEPIGECASWIRDEMKAIKLSGDGTGAKLSIGEVFYSDLRLRQL